jgi:phenylalanyl-tRNA synthetase beta subunit
MLIMQKDISQESRILVKNKITLTDEEVEKAQGKIQERLTKELGATLRG